MLQMSYKTELHREKMNLNIFFQTHFRIISLNLSFSFEAFFSFLKHLSFFGDYLPLVSNYSLSSLLRELMTILHCFINGLQVNSFKSFRNNCFFV